MIEYIQNYLKSLFYSYKIRKEVNASLNFISSLGYYHYHIENIDNSFNNDNFSIIFEQEDENTGIKICIYYQNIVFGYSLSPQRYYFTFNIKENVNNYSSKTCITKYNRFLSIKKPVDIELLSYYYISLKNLNEFLNIIISQLEFTNKSVFKKITSRTRYFKFLEKQSYLNQLKSLFPKEIKSEHLYQQLNNKVSKKNNDKKISKKI